MKRTYISNGFRLLLACLLCLPPCARAESRPALAAPPAPVTLARDLQALPSSAVEKGIVVLTVSPGSVTPVPPSTEAAPSPGAAAQKAPAPEPPVTNLESIVAYYGRVQTRFGHVAALAPPTMTVLNTSPSLAVLPLGQFAGQHPETYLLGSLTPEQLRQVGGSGLAYADMTPDQQSLMHDLLPEPLEIVPVAANTPGLNMEQAEREAKEAEFDAQVQKVSGDTLFSGLRLHAYLTGDFFVHAPSGYGIGDTRDLIETTGAFKLPNSGYGNMEARGKSTATALRADVPNAPKPSDLDWTRPALRHTVSLQNINTVDALVGRLARATGLELYADTHYGPQALLAVGDVGAPQSAGDVMQALALCVCGTWRRVGPAYVLTDDVQGLGARQQFLSETGEIWANRLSQAGKDAGARLQSLDWLHALPFVPGDIGALSAAQIDAIQKEADGGNAGHLPWKDLPFALQTHLRDIFLHYGDDFPAAFRDKELAEPMKAMRSAAQTVRPDSVVDTTLNIRLAVELPTTGAMMLYGDYKVQSLKADDNSAAKDNALAPRAAITLPEPLRAVLCAPKTPDEARAVLAALPKLGLNTLYLDVFTGGRTYFPNTALPPASDKASGVLQAALDAARPLHIPVYAVVDTFCWRKDGLAAHPQPWPRGYAEDLTISGEAPDRAIQRRASAGSLSAQYNHPRFALASEGNEGWASPLDPAVRATLPPLVGALAATPGLAGLVFQDAAPPGYAENDIYGDHIGLGYTLDNRLAYLRRMHQDPIDVAGGYDFVSVYVGGENFFGHYAIGIPTFPGNGLAAWKSWRAQADQSLLAACWRAAHAAAPTLPTLRRKSLGWAEFVPWTVPVQVDAPRTARTAAFGPAPTSRSILGAAFGPDEQAHPNRFLMDVQDAAGTRGGDGGKAHNPPAGGIVIDLVSGGPPDSLAGTLHRLGGYLQAPAETPNRVPAITSTAAPLPKE